MAYSGNMGETMAGGATAPGGDEPAMPVTISASPFAGDTEAVTWKPMIIGVTDYRITPQKAVEPLEITPTSNQTFTITASSASTSGLGFANSLPADGGLWVDPRFLLDVTMYFQMLATVNTAHAQAAFVSPALTQVATFGVDWTFGAYPLHSLMSAESLGLNNVAIQLVQPQNTNPVIQQLGYTGKRAAQQFGPCAPPQYVDNNDGYLTANDPMATYDVAMKDSFVKNGTYVDWVYTTQSGALLSGTGSFVQTVFTIAAPSTDTMYYANGIPVMASAAFPAAPPATYATTYGIWVAARAVEFLQMTPLEYGLHPSACGFIGLAKMNFTCSFRSPGAARIIQQRSNGPGRVGLSLVDWNNQRTNGAVQQGESRMQFLMLGPPLRLPPPPEQFKPLITPLFYQFSTSNALAANATDPVTAASMDVPGVPLYVACVAVPKDAHYTTNPTQSPWQLCVGADATAYLQTSTGAVTLTYNGGETSLTSYLTEQYYIALRKNGIRDPWVKFRGAASMASGVKTPLSASVFLLRPGEDFNLGNFSAPGVDMKLQLTIIARVRNQSATTLTNGYNFYVIPIMRGGVTLLPDAGMLTSNPFSVPQVQKVPILNAAPSTADMRVQAGGSLTSGGGIFDSLTNLYNNGRKAHAMYQEHKDKIQGAINTARGAVDTARGMYNGLRGGGASGGAASGISSLASSSASAASAAAAAAAAYGLPVPIVQQHKRKKTSHAHNLDAWAAPGSH